MFSLLRVNHFSMIRIFRCYSLFFKSVCPTPKKNLATVHNHLVEQLPILFETIDVSADKPCCNIMVLHAIQLMGFIIVIKIWALIYPTDESVYV